MALYLTVPPENPPTGLTGGVRPINEGEARTVVPDQEGGGLFRFLDDLRTTAENGAKDILQAAAQRKVAELTAGAEAAETTTGVPYQNPQDTRPAADMSFYEKNKTPILIGGALMAGVLVYALTRG